MDLEKILSAVDHTLLTQGATWEEIKGICDDGMKYHTASVCIPPSYVRQAKEYVKDALAVCTVIGFPNGYSTTAVKCFETEDAVKNGADEIDMVINIGWVKDKKWEEKIKMCEIVSQSGAEYIKTSTGFAGGGATREDVALFAQHVAPHVKIKAAGGIASLQDAQDFLDLGASRLGTSRIVKAVKGLPGSGY